MSEKANRSGPVCLANLQARAVLPIKTGTWFGIGLRRHRPRTGMVQIVLCIHCLRLRKSTTSGRRPSKPVARYGFDEASQ
jgi:hypothetical protein